MRLFYHKIVAMSILYLLVPLALVLAGVGVWGFLWAVRSGQFDDVETPAIRVLLEDEVPHPLRNTGLSTNGAGKPMADP